MHLGLVEVFIYPGITQERPRQQVTDERAEEPLVKVSNGLVTINARNRPLGWIFGQLLQASGIPIISSGNVGDSLVSVELHNVPLDGALQQILRGYDAFFFHGTEGDSPASLKAVWVYEKGRGKGVQPVPFELWASTKELEEQLANPDADIRARAYEGVIERRRSGALAAVLKAVKEERDISVRTRIFYTALRKGLQFPPDVLISLVYSDSSEVIRLLSLNNLYGDPSLRSVATSALQDPSPNVQNRAREILRELDGSGRLTVP
jgi:hypothetical protein